MPLLLLIVQVLTTRALYAKNCWNALFCKGLLAHHRFPPVFGAPKDMPPHKGEQIHSPFFWAIFAIKLGEKRNLGQKDGSQNGRWPYIYIYVYHKHVKPISQHTWKSKSTNSHTPNFCTVSVLSSRMGAKGGKPWKIPCSTVEAGWGVLRRLLSFLFLRGLAPSKKHACFLEGAAWNFAQLPPLGPSVLSSLFSCCLSSSGEAFSLTVGASLLTVKRLCLQSLKALIRRTFPL